MNCIFCVYRSREWKLKTLMEGDTSRVLFAAYHLLELRDFSAFQEVLCKSNSMSCKWY